MSAVELRGACKGCKHAVQLQFRDGYECVASAKFKVIKKPPKKCDKRRSEPSE